MCDLIVSEPQPLYRLLMENTSAIQLAKNGNFTGRSKHISVRHWFLHDLYSDGLISIAHVSTEDQIADICTKALSRGIFEKFATALVV